MPSTSVLPIFLLLVASTRSVPVQSSHDALQESILLRQFHHEAAELSKPILLQLDGGKHFKTSTRSRMSPGSWARRLPSND